MRVPDQVRKAVGFIGYEDKRNGEIVPVGSFFFLGHDPHPGEKFSPKMYAVTARHVIDARLHRHGSTQEGARTACTALQSRILRLGPSCGCADIQSLLVQIEINALSAKLGKERVEVLQGAA